MKYAKPIVRILLSITLIVMLVLAFVNMPKQRCERIQVVAHTQNESVILSQRSDRGSGKHYSESIPDC